jgi:peptidoglycan/xylan/chitin deacetylase (PgdA/CDA1 family)
MSTNLMDLWKKSISWARHKTECRALILMYHRIMVEDSLDDQITVSPTHFREHLEVLRRYDIIQLDQLAQGLKRGSIPHDAVAITFDDGYATSLFKAKTILDAFDMPATAFIISGAVKGKATFWWEKLEKILLDSKALPQNVNLGNGNILELKIAGSNLSGGAQEKRTQGNECNENVLSQSQRRSLYTHLIHQLLRMTEYERNRVLDALVSVTGVDMAQVGLRCSLSEKELMLLAHDPMITIGAHTITHPLLSVLPVEEQRAEIEASKDFLEGVLGRKVTGFSYPYGGYNQDTLELVHEAGFNYACTVDPKVVRKDANVLELPRMTVEDWDGDEFAKRLRNWFNGIY